MNVFGPGPRDYNRAVYRFSEDMEEMVRNGVSEESEKFQRVKAQWAYACALRDHYETHSSSARRNASAT
jgi:predicted ATPase